MDPNAVQAAQILSSFKIDEFFNGHHKVITSSIDPVGIQYVITPANLPREVQLIHTPASPLILNLDKKN